ncbi:MAG TPA: hypothetical protein VK639_01415, partial [Terriglobales bacterium]|nr:hypothetical protein [Terriglobales bacterium]
MEKGYLSYPARQCYRPEDKKQGLLRSREVADGDAAPITYRRTGKEHYAMINTLTRWEPMELADVENRLSRFFGRRTNGRDDIT